MTHPQVFGQKFTLIGRFLAWKTHPVWPHIPNMTQYGSAPSPGEVFPSWLCKRRSEKQIIPKIFAHDNKHLLDETESNIQFIASGQGNIGRSEAEPNIILYGRNQLDVGGGQVQ